MLELSHGDRQLAPVLKSSFRLLVAQELLKESITKLSGCSFVRIGHVCPASYGGSGFAWTADLAAVVSRRFLCSCCFFSLAVFLNAQHPILTLGGAK